MRPRVSNAFFPRSVARIAAVQALFQKEISGGDHKDVADDFLAYRVNDHGCILNEEDGALPIDASHFRSLVKNVSERTSALDAYIAPFLPEGWDMSRLEGTTRCLLRCATLELIKYADISTAVILDEYITVAHAFLLDRGPAFVNGILDGVKTLARPVGQNSPEIASPTSPAVIEPLQALPDLPDLSTVPHESAPPNES